MITLGTIRWPSPWLGCLLLWGVWCSSSCPWFTAGSSEASLRRRPPPPTCCPRHSQRGSPRAAPTETSCLVTLTLRHTSDLHSTKVAHWTIIYIWPRIVCVHQEECKCSPPSPYNFFPFAFSKGFSPPAPLTHHYIVHLLTRALNHGLS